MKHRSFRLLVQYWNSTFRKSFWSQPKPNRIVWLNKDQEVRKAIYCTKKQAKLFQKKMIFLILLFGLLVGGALAQEGGADMYLMTYSLYSSSRVRAAVVDGQTLHAHFLLVNVASLVGVLQRLLCARDRISAGPASDLRNAVQTQRRDSAPTHLRTHFMVSIACAHFFVVLWLLVAAVLRKSRRLPGAESKKKCWWWSLWRWVRVGFFCMWSIESTLGFCDVPFCVLFCIFVWVKEKNTFNCSYKKK